MCVRESVVRVCEKERERERKRDRERVRERNECSSICNLSRKPLDVLFCKKQVAHFFIKPQARSSKYILRLCRSEETDL